MKKVLSLLVVLVLFAGFTNGQSKFTEKGVWELGGAVSFSSNTPVANGNTGTATTILSLSPSGGYFLMDNFQIGVSPSFSSVSSGGSSFTSFNLFLSPTYYFSTSSKMFPYVEGSIGYSSASSGGSSLSGISYGFGGGAKFSFGESSLINVGLSYMLYTLNPSGADKRYGSNVLALSAGYTIWIK